MKYTHEELNKRCEKYFEELIEKGTDPDEIQDLCVIFLENGGRKYVPKWYSKKKALEEDFEKELVPFAEDNKDAVYYIDPISYADDLYERLYNILITLTKRETSVLYYRFGENLTLDQTKKIFNVTRERIRQVEAKALRKIRHPWRSRNIRDFVDAYNSGMFYNVYIDKPESISGSNDFLKVFKEACDYLAENKSVDILTEPVKKKPLVRDIDNNWKREFKISKSIYDGNSTRAERFKTKIKYSTSECKKSIADRRREVGLSILKRIKNHEYDPSNFCSILSEAYKLIYGSKSSMRIYHSVQTMKDYNYNAFENIEKYIDFANSNIDWVLTIISNMVKRRIIDIKYNTIDFSRSCNLIDKYMETRSIESVIDGTIYRNIEDYDEFGCKLPQLDHHYVALFDIVYMLKACCEYKRF